MQQNAALFTGFRAFTLVWIGQLASLLGSSMTRFALTIWAYQQTESATVLALVGFFSFAPLIIFSPIAGALTDRWNRKLVMMLSDSAAGMTTVALFLLYSTDNLEIWHLYIAGAVASTFEAFQFPAFSAAITMMVDKKQYSRASSMLEMARAGADILAPALAGFFIATMDIDGVMMFDMVTFIFAVGAIALVHVPQPKVTAEGAASRGNLLQESVFGFKYIWNRRSLFRMQMIFFFANLFGTMSIILLAPMVLASTGNHEGSLAAVQSMMGVGGLVGGLFMTTWGGPKRRVHGVFIGMACSGFFGNIIIGLGQSVVIWSMGAFLLMFFMPVLNASNQAIWQSKVPAEIQGRVFSARRLIAQVTGPISMLSAGPLADQLFEPAMMPGGALADTFGGLVGTGPGSGMALIFIITGIFGIMNGLSGYLFPYVRNIETLLPDVDTEAAEEKQPVSQPDVIMEPDDAPAPATM